MPHAAEPGMRCDIEEEAALEEQEAAHQEAGVAKQVPVAGVRGVARLSSVHHPIRLVQVLTSKTFMIKIVLFGKFILN